jgi:hypothetical protein
MRLLTGRRAILPTDPELIAHGDYLVMGKEIRHQHQIPWDLLESSPDAPSLRPVFENEGFVVYEVGKDE